jgi:AraC-like DNA-binding protein
VAMILDTDTLPEQDREEAYLAGFLSSEVPHTLDLHVSDEPVRVRMDFWDLGSGMHILRNYGSGVRIFRTAKQLKIAAPETVAIGFKLGGPGMFEINDRNQNLRAGDIHLVDQTTTMNYTSPTTGGSQALMIQVDRLGLPIDTVRRAIFSLDSSPVYQLFRSHMGQVCHIVDNLPSGPGRTMFTEASLELTRALIATAAGDSKRQRDALHDSEFTRVSLYVNQHLLDQDLSAEGIARANYLSLRQLYKVWAVSELSLSEYIIRERWEGARRQLERHDEMRQSVGSIASAWGFLSSAHFSRRFKDAYGISPKEWRQLSVGD